MKLRDKLERLSPLLHRSPPPPPSEVEIEAEAVVVYDAEEPAALASRSGRDEPLRTVGDLRARLAAMQSSKPRPPLAQRAERKLQQRPRDFASLLFDDEALPEGRVPAPRREVPGERVETPLGALYKTVVRCAADHQHGSVRVADAARAAPAEVSLLALDPSLAGIDWSRALYLDTETTGLSGGSGTLPFLIGMAWFEGEEAVVEQLLLPRPGHEQPMLLRLAERLAQASAIVSYNGKSFDWPLLRTRFVLNRVPTPALPAHLDLLHCARRVYKPRLGSVRLVHLEQEILGFERIDDLPGELIPERYFAFLRGHGEAATLKPILDHNRSDLLALPALLAELLRRFSHEPRQDARDRLSFARVAARGAEAERAIALAHAAVEADVRGELSAHALYLIGELQLRKGALEAAVDAFERAAESSSCALDRGRAHLALAKLHEHKTKQCERALQHALLALELEGEAGKKRVARLTGRLEKRARP